MFCFALKGWEFSPFRVRKKQLYCLHHGKLIMWYWFIYGWLPFQTLTMTLVGIEHKICWLQVLCSTTEPWLLPSRVHFNTLSRKLEQHCYESYWTNYLWKKSANQMLQLNIWAANDLVKTRDMVWFILRVVPLAKVLHPQWNMKILQTLLPFTPSVKYSQYQNTIKNGYKQLLSKSE